MQEIVSQLAAFAHEMHRDAGDLAVRAQRDLHAVIAHCDGRLRLLLQRDVAERNNLLRIIFIEARRDLEVAGALRRRPVEFADNRRAFVDVGEFCDVGKIVLREHRGLRNAVRRLDLCDFEGTVAVRRRGVRRRRDPAVGVRRNNLDALAVAQIVDAVDRAVCEGDARRRRRGLRGDYRGLDIRGRRSRILARQRRVSAVKVERAALRRAVAVDDRRRRLRSRPLDRRRSRSADLQGLVLREIRRRRNRIFLAKAYIRLAGHCAIHVDRISARLFRILLIQRAVLRIVRVYRRIAPLVIVDLDELYRVAAQRQAAVCRGGNLNRRGKLAGLQNIEIFAACLELQRLQAADGVGRRSVAAALRRAD